MTLLMETHYQEGQVSLQILLHLKRQEYPIIISIYQIDDTKLYIVVYIGMLDRDVGRVWQLL